jgi:hypothetical protein
MVNLRRFRGGMHNCASSSPNVSELSDLSHRELEKGTLRSPKEHGTRTERSVLSTLWQEADGITSSASTCRYARCRGYHQGCTLRQSNDEQASAELARVTNQSLTDGFATPFVSKRG